MLTGQYPRTNGSWNNGIALSHDSQTVAEVLHDAGFRTALIGKAHFEPYSSKHSMETFGLRVILFSCNSLEDPITYGFFKTRCSNKS